MATQEEFKEIAHSGGRLTIHIVRDASGRRLCSLEWSNCRPVAAAIFSVWALPQGIPIAHMNLGGFGSAPEQPPVPGCYQVFIGSDSQGKFGHQCPVCEGYWRGDALALVCPYCGIRAPSHGFLTQAQRSYLQQCCERMYGVLSGDIDGDHVIDMDAVADAAGKEIEKPAFYYSEQSQQNQFTCEACGSFNDVLGTFCYCQRCGTRNDVQEFTARVIPDLRARINSGAGYESCVADAVAAFDSLVGRLSKELIQHVSITAARRAKFDNRRFHNLRTVATDLKDVFDIDILDGVPTADVECAALMFHRRHVYEHGGGEADDKYIADSGDTSVRPKQALRETKESAHRLAGIILRMATNLQRGFHELLPPEQWPVLRRQRLQSKPSMG